MSILGNVRELFGAAAGEGRSLVLEQLEDRIVLDGAVDNQPQDMCEAGSSFVDPEQQSSDVPVLAQPGMWVWRDFCWCWDGGTQDWYYYDSHWYFNDTSSGNWWYFDSSGSHAQAAPSWFSSIT